MGKLKTHKGIAKVTKLRPGKTIKINRAGGNHNTGKKSTAFNRRVRGSYLMSKADFNRLKKVVK